MPQVGHANADDNTMDEPVICPNCGVQAERLIGRLYRCRVCKSHVKAWEQDETHSEEPKGA